MTTQNIGLMQAIGAKMDYLNQRQRIVSQNIANADTPNYKPQDLKPLDFSAVLSDVSTPNKLHMTSTNPGHMPASDGKIDDPKSAKSKNVYEVSPTGNAVVMEEQLLKANDTMADYNLMASLYQKQVRLIQTALGRNG